MARPLAGSSAGQVSMGERNREEERERDREYSWPEMIFIHSAVGGIIKGLLALPIHIAVCARFVEFWMEMCDEVAALLDALPPTVSRRHTLCMHDLCETRDNTTILSRCR